LTSAFKASALAADEGLRISSHTAEACASSEDTPNLLAS
jgi:hypothetical protein